MASLISLPKLSFFLLLIITLAFFSSPSAAQTKCNIKSVYQFGDSLADAGNVIRTPGANIIFRANRAPYGQTFFKRPTGRFSDGRIIIDYISSALKLSFLNAYLDSSNTFSQGVNFAVAGATTLNSSFWAARNVRLPAWNTPLAAQLGWFKSHLQSTCGSNCAQTLSNSLVVMGEWGGNDYYNNFFQRKQLPEVRTYVPFVVAGIMRGIKDVIQLGATRILVPGFFPLGCLPLYLTTFPDTNANAYDQLGCLRNYNDFASYHHRYLNRGLDNLRREFPSVKIVYGDYNGAFLTLLQSASSFGFNQNTLLTACCGTGGRYNFNFSNVCGSASVTACSNPAQYVHWDGIHLTDEAHRRITDIIVKDMLSRLGCTV
ncbi:PREDICTED: GDSL esterase/lipase At1g28590-like [Nicotiana attenuata]|uniref:Gdsl esteraselipase n=1 Tax=Nicotiana attenuata TaxID=49451 RepID=A0A1J6I6J8_NICAT|nr:PREDICTED: GDSL esterase/lipase At1g28590-like [Nicotiana attenuata]OIT00637.1 gdsl esteraselipase [Nicotiana attenuata]